jgi:hypothetical protein
MWSSGDPILLRWFWGAALGRVWPATVVEDSPDTIALYVRAGTATKVRVREDGTPIARSLPYRERFAVPWRIGDGVFAGLSALLLTRPGAGHAFMPFWRDGGEFAAWYVNIQTPLERTRWGFDTEDLVLDLVFENGVVRWKDEDELEQAVELGRFTPAQAAEIRREGERAVATIEAGEWPLGSGWEAWRPDPSWRPATLPGGDAYLE